MVSMVSSFLGGPYNTADFATAVFDGIGGQDCTRCSDDWRHDIIPFSTAYPNTELQGVC